MADQINPSPTDQPLQTPEPNQPTHAETVPQAKSHLLPILVGLAVVALVGAGVYIFYRHSQTKTNAAEVKKEIPLITYGYTDEGSNTTLYPATPILDYINDVNLQIFEGLVQYQGINQIKPNLAVSWSNPDDSTWDFQLEQNVKFHTGRTMTAADVKYSLEHLSGTDTGKIYADTIKTVQAVNDHEVKIATSGPDPLLLNKLAFLYIIDSQSTLKNSAENGTGPYTIKPDTTATAQEIDLVAYDSWHGGRPLTRAINFKVYADEDSLTAAAKKGEVTVAADIFESNNQAALAALPDYKDFKFQSIGESVIRINSKKAKSPLSDKRVRQALSNSLDLAAVLKARGLDGVVANQIVSSDIPGFNPAIAPHVHDVAKAQALLKEAGYPNGLTLPMQSIKQPTNAVQDEIAKEAKEAGITVVWKYYADGDSEEADIAAGKMDAFGYSITSTILDASDIFSLYFLGADYNNLTVNDLAQSASKTLDAGKRLQLLQQISQILMDDTAIIPLYSRVQHWYADPSYVMTRDRAGTSFGVNFAKVYAADTTKK